MSAVRRPEIQQLLDELRIGLTRVSIHPCACLGPSCARILRVLLAGLASCTAVLVLLPGFACCAAMLARPLLLLGPRSLTTLACLAWSLGDAGAPAAGSCLTFQLRDD